MKRLLNISYWIGIVADGIAAIILFFPKLADVIFQPKLYEISAMYLYGLRIAGSLMLGWTVLLFWASRKPVKRADILIITVFPVVISLTAVSILVVVSGYISLLRMLPLFILYVLIFSTFIPSYWWCKKRQGKE